MWDASHPPNLPHEGGDTHTTATTDYTTRPHPPGPAPNTHYPTAPSSTTDRTHPADPPRNLHPLTRGNPDAPRTQTQNARARQQSTTGHATKSGPPKP